MTLHKKLLQAAAAFIVCVGLLLPMLAIDSHAAQVKVWDGLSELETGHIYYVTDTVKLRRTVEIPAGAKLSVRNGGELRILPSGKMNVYGELAVAIGGLVKNSGELNIRRTGVFSVYGTAQSSLNGFFTASGSVNIYNKGLFETSSTMKFYSGSSVFVKGELKFYKSSDVKLSGSLVGNETSDIELRGIFSVTLGGSVEVNGHLTVGARSNVRCSGTLTLTETATYTRFNKITFTKSGHLADKRPDYEFHDMTVDILIDEPDVYRRGMDVSYAQGEIDWERVAASGIDFAIIRAGRGRAGKDNTMMEDIRFRYNITEAQKYGIDVGVYFYSYATTVSEAKEEAEFFVDIIKDYKIQYPVILDLEETFQGQIGKKKLTNMIDAFFEVLMQNRFYPMLYSYKSWIESNLDMTTLDKYAVWLAQVNDRVTYDGGYYIWQYSFTGKISGIDYDIDLDISYKDWPEILKKYRLNNL